MIPSVKQDPLGVDVQEPVGSIVIEKPQNNEMESFGADLSSLNVNVNDDTIMLSPETYDK